MLTLSRVLISLAQTVPTINEYWTFLVTLSRKGVYASILSFFSPYIALISAFARQMALLGFIFPLFISPETCHLMVEDYSRACQRERKR